MALMHLRLETWDQVKETASAAVRITEIINQQRAKALYRQELAHREHNDTVAAEQALEEAGEHAPDDVDIHNALTTLKKRKQNTTQKTIQVIKCSLKI